MLRFRPVARPVIHFHYSENGKEKQASAASCGTGRGLRPGCGFGLPLLLQGVHKQPGNVQQMGVLPVGRRQIPLESRCVHRKVGQLPKALAGNAGGNAILMSFSLLRESGDIPVLKASFLSTCLCLAAFSYSHCNAIGLWGEVPKSCAV